MGSHCQDSASAADRLAAARERVLHLCGGLPGVGEHADLCSQVVRILFRALGRERLEAICSEADVLGAFRSMGCTPPKWVEMLREISPPPAGFTEESWALAFAACTHPQRAWGRPPTALALQLPRFTAFLGQLAETGNALDAIRKHLRRELPELKMADETLGDLLRDLGAADSPHLGPQEAKERETGAALHLATCHPALIKRMLRNWEADAALVQFLRERYLPGHPSEPRGQEVSLFEQAMRLESWVEDRTRDRPDLAQMLWQSLREHLDSGFPHFAFHSRLRSWLRQCLVNLERGHARESAELTAVDSVGPLAWGRTNWDSALSAMDGLGPDDLGWIREGYRLVRVTFQSRSGDPVKSNALRLHLDAAALRALWKGADAVLAGPRDDLEDMLSSEISANTTYQLVSRLRQRMLCHKLARLDRLSNRQVLAALGDRPALQTLASLVRFVPPDCSLLGVFTAHLLLRPVIDPPHAEHWTLVQWLRELWHWLAGGTLFREIQSGVRRGFRVESAVSAAMGSSSAESLARLIRALEKAQSEPVAEALLQQMPPQDLERVGHEVRALLEHVTGPDAVGAFDRCLGAWRSTHRRAGWLASNRHWAVPVWYLTALEGCRGDDLLRRLGVDAAEGADVGKFAEFMRKELR